ncbi:MAG: dTDP-4-dehydrorhamnose reductase, partial [Acidimicrobiales bacterium]
MGDGCKRALTPRHLVALPRLMVTGASGQLGHELGAALAREASFEVIALDHGALPVDDLSAVMGAFQQIAPAVAIHAAAMTDVDACERDPTRARAVNATGTANVTKAAQAHGTHVVYVSTDYVFDGQAHRPYKETDEANPISVYGQTKLAGESACAPTATIVRTSWLAGGHGRNFVSAITAAAKGGGQLRVVDDQRARPTFCEDLASAIVALAKERRPGCFHVANSGDASRFELAVAILSCLGEDADRVVAASTQELDPPRP